MSHWRPLRGRKASAVFMPAGSEAAAACLRYHEARRRGDFSLPRVPDDAPGVIVLNDDDNPSPEILEYLRRRRRDGIAVHDPVIRAALASSRTAAAAVNRAARASSLQSAMIRAARASSLQSAVIRAARASSLQSAFNRAARASSRAAAAVLAAKAQRPPTRPSTLPPGEVQPEAAAHAAGGTWPVRSVAGQSVSGAPVVVRRARAAKGLSSMRRKAQVSANTASAQHRALVFTDTIARLAPQVNVLSPVRELEAPSSVQADLLPFELAPATATPANA